MNRVLRTKGAERVRRGWMRECSTVGRTRVGGHKYEGRLRRMESARRGWRDVGVAISLRLLVPENQTLRRAICAVFIPRSDDIEGREDQARGDGGRGGNAQ